MKRSFANAFPNALEEETSNNSISTHLLSIDNYNDLLARSKSSQVSFDELINNCLDIYNYQVVTTKPCKCNPYSSFVRAGPFILGAQLNDAQFADLDQFIARRIDQPDSNLYYLLKIVTLPINKEEESYQQRQAKLLLFNEYSVLSLLKDQDGVIHHQGLYMDYFYEKITSLESQADDDQDKTTNSLCLNYLNSFQSNLPESQPAISPETSHLQSDTSPMKDDDNSTPPPSQCNHQSHQTLNHKPYSGRLMRRIILAFDCYIPHIFCSTVQPFPNAFSKFKTFNSEYENLQEYVKRFKSISELKALQIFNEIVNVIYDLHHKNIAHRDLRLENILYNHRNGKIVLINFGLSRYVINDSICICDHRGSSAYISPDVLKRRPYNPKASDCWALGIIFYTMLFGKFPFYADTFADLFKKINSGQFTIPSNVHVWKGSHELQPGKTDSHSIVISSETMDLINALIVTDTQKRMNISQLQEQLKLLIEAKFRSKNKVENQRLIKQSKCINEDLQVVPDMDLPEFQNSLLKHNLEILSSRTGVKIDEKLQSYFNLHKIATDATEMVDPLYEPNLIESSLFSGSNSSRFFSKMYDLVERRNRLSMRANGNNQLIREHLHDHTYSQRDQNTFTPNSSLLTKNGPSFNSFDVYLKSSKFLSSPTTIPSPYFSNQSRFYLKCGLSLYTPNPTYSKSLLLEKSGYRKVKHTFSSVRSYHNNNSSSKSIPNFHPNKHSSLSDKNARRALNKSNKVPILSGSLTKSNFSVLKIDGDIRPLNEQEMNLVKQHTFKANSQL